MDNDREYTQEEKTTLLGAMIHWEDTLFEAHEDARNNLPRESDAFRHFGEELERVTALRRKLEDDLFIPSTASNEDKYRERAVTYVFESYVTFSSKDDDPTFVDRCTEEDAWYYIDIAEPQLVRVEKNVYR